MQLLVTNGYSETNYGKWLNTVMESSPCEWVMIHDHDIYLANKDWYSIVVNNIERSDNPGLLTCVTNRIGNGEQKIKTDIFNHNLEYHWHIAKQQEGKPLREPTKPISGVVMVTSKTAWGKAGGFVEDRVIGLDNRYHGDIIRAGYKVYIMDDMYVYHRYRI